MPLKRKKETEETKNQGGKKLTEEEIRGVAAAVKALIDQDKDKEKVSQELGAMKRQIGQASEDTAEMKKLLCLPDGSVCFATKEEMDVYMQKHGDTVKKLDGKLDEVIEAVKNTKPASPAVPEGLKRLPKITEEIRKTMTEEDNRVRDLEAKKIADFYNETDNDRWRRMREDEVNLDIIAGKGEIVERVLKNIPNMPGDQKGKISKIICTDQSCRVEMGKEGYHIFKEDPKTKKWQWMDGEKEAKKGGFDIF